MNAPQAQAYDDRAARRAANLDAITARIGAHPDLNEESATRLCEAVDPDDLSDDELRADITACNTL